MIRYGLIAFALTFCSFSSFALSVAHQQKNSFIVKGPAPATASKANEYAKQICGAQRFCLVWFVAGETEAAKAIEAMRAGNLDGTIVGLYAIYSRNKVNDNIICYDDKYWC